mmetsp:Transcript_3902/g.8930  ORF Transcript_3902/g.8930 Transcript_3902/m.8930 type:complete len:328 (+) Transcript_3902:217-1200(+)
MNAGGGRLIRNRAACCRLPSLFVYLAGFSSGVFFSLVALSLWGGGSSSRTTFSQTYQLESSYPSGLSHIRPAVAGENTSNATTTIHDVHDESRSSPLQLLTPNELRLPTPIIVMGLMKAGTTSIYSYFRCGMDLDVTKISHYDCRPRKHFPTITGMACGKRMQKNINEFKPPRPIFDGLDEFHIYTELDALYPNGGMTIPQWSFVERIHLAYPNATWILNTRDPQKWLESVNRWDDMRQHFVNNPFPPVLPRGKGAKDEDMLEFYNAQAQRIRDFVAADDHSSHTLVEVKIDSDDAGQVMESAFGIDRRCWGNRNANVNGTAIWTGK